MIARRRTTSTRSASVIASFCHCVSCRVCLNRQQVEGILCFLERELGNGERERCGSIGKDFLYPRDICLEDAFCTIDALGDLWQRGDRQE
jgi:hypothetical protein